MHHIHSAYPVQDYHLILEFDHEEYRVVDMFLFIRNQKFEPLNDTAMFKQVKVGTESGTLYWPEGIAVDSDTLYENSLPLVLPIHEI